MIKIGRTEDHHFTITTQMNQQVEFFHSLIFDSIIRADIFDDNVLK